MINNENGRVIIFGASGTGQKIYQQIKDSSEVICFLDNNQRMWGTDIDGIEIKPPEVVKDMEFEKVYIGSMCGIDEINSQLIHMGVPQNKIVRDTVLVQVKSRILFLKRMAEIINDRNLQGAVAELGVYQGEFAKEINSLFPTKKLYLFDTFEGFPEDDVRAENGQSFTDADYLKDTSVEKVLSKMKYREQCIVCKGYFPDTATHIDERFCFVSLDVDLYKPTLEGLRYFVPRLTTGGGGIALHDYFSDAYPNVKAAVADYEKEIGYKLTICPIGDDLSIAILK